jgi:hypothetical protein
MVLLYLPFHEHSLSLKDRLAWPPVATNVLWPWQQAADVGCHQSLSLDPTVVHYIFLIMVLCFLMAPGLLPVKPAIACTALLGASFLNMQKTRVVFAYGRSWSGLPLSAKPVLLGMFLTENFWCR